ncbi:putative lipoprotein [Plesiocystis pacifica SIR-1]|uniref:Putative lipoprotein n=1 Tax=Plesiocystis pacifica SIR-1 TaxID=391625 RepID=A6GHW4_9BACT|nr:hypothetical protein [Plesiocystis pacifica]EDM74561.1 putative lipoprotein [Plesiocystis pacifica SIR-1]
MTTTRISFLASLLFLITPALACDATIAGDGADDEVGSDSGNDNGDGNGDGDNWTPCSDDNACPDGQFCWNGLCAIGCQSDANCAENQYCNTDIMLCQNTEVPTCDDNDDCASSQVCINGYCSTPPDDGSCNLEDYLNDGCDSNAVCLVEDIETETGACYTMPACAEDGSCPVGIEGAVCNEGYLSNKDEICLVGMCEADSHCPTDWNCVRQIENAVLGVCSSGSFGAPCATADDCASGNCITIPGLSGGFCG